MAQVLLAIPGQQNCFVSSHGMLLLLEGQVCTSAARTTWPWELMVCGSAAACLAAAHAPKSGVSADTETGVYELTFILESLIV